MKTCNNCGIELDDVAVFCPKCGLPVENNVDVYCSQCGHKVNKDNKFCESCGKKLSDLGSNNNINNKYDNEENILTVNANLFKGIEGVGGKLRITNKQLIFTSHSFNIQTGTTVIQISDITRVYPKNLGGLVPTGMCINTFDGTEYKFVVYNRTKIIALINSLKLK